MGDKAMKDTKLLLALNSISLRQDIEKAIGRDFNSTSLAHHDPKDWSGVLSKAER